MTDEVFVNKILNKNYKITLDEKGKDFAVITIFDGKVLSINDFQKEVLNLIGEFTAKDGRQSADLISAWCQDQILNVTKDVGKYLRRIKKNKGSITMHKRLIDKFSKSQYGEALLTKIFDNYYQVSYMEPKVNEFIRKLESFGELKGSAYLDKAFLDNHGLHERETQIRFAKKKIFKWYQDKYLDKKIKDTLSQLYLSLGKTNWDVMKIGVGRIGAGNDSKTILKCFHHEHKEMEPIISQKFHNWYDEEVIKASSDEMKKVYHTTIGDLVESGKIKVNENSIKDLDL